MLGIIPTFPHFATQILPIMGISARFWMECGQLEPGIRGFDGSNAQRRGLRRVALHSLSSGGCSLDMDSHPWRRATMDDPAGELQRAIELIPGGIFVVCSSFGRARTGVIARSAQVCSDSPLLVCVALPKGHVIDPMIRDSRAFSVCRIGPEDRLLLRNFQRAIETEPEERYDPFDSLQVEKLEPESPVIARAMMGLDCEVIGHFDLEADHELFVGRVLAGRVFEADQRDRSA